MDSAAESLVTRALGAGGSLLPASERRFFGPRLGRKLGDVRIHTDDNAERAARSLDAHAFTKGHHIAFGKGAYRPGTVAGRRLIAHELAHVAQRAASGGDTIMRSAVDPGNRMPDDLQGSARDVGPDGELGIHHEITPLDQRPRLAEGKPRIEYNDHEFGWTEFRSGVDADYSGYGTFFDVQYPEGDADEKTKRPLQSNLEYYGRIYTRAAGFTDDALANEDWVLGATNIYYEQRNSQTKEVLEKGIVRSWFVNEGTKDYTIGDAITLLGVAGSAASIIALFLR